MTTEHEIDSFFGQHYSAKFFHWFFMAGGIFWWGMVIGDHRWPSGLWIGAILFTSWYIAALLWFSISYAYGKGKGYFE